MGIVFDGGFQIGLVIGLAAMYIFKPLVDSGLSKLFKKNK